MAGLDALRPMERELLAGVALLGSNRLQHEGDVIAHVGALQDLPHEAVQAALEQRAWRFRGEAKRR